LSRRCNDRGVGGWVRRQGRKVDRRRELEIGWRAAPEDAAEDETEVEFKVRLESQAEDASRKRAGRQSRRIDRGRKPEMGLTVRLEG